MFFFVLYVLLYVVSVLCFCLFRVLFLVMCTVVSFLFVYKRTDYCHRVDTKLQLINVISYKSFLFSVCEIQRWPDFGTSKLDRNNYVSILPGNATEMEQQCSLVTSSDITTASAFRPLLRFTRHRRARAATCLARTLVG
jgi:hypothetical protein